MTKTRMVTVIVQERSSPFPPVYDQPLIYDVEMNEDLISKRRSIELSEAARRTIIASVSKQRYEDFGCGDSDDPSQQEIMEEIADGLQVILVLDGSPQILIDGRS